MISWSKGRDFEHSLAKLHLEPGDIVVVKFPRLLTEAAARQLREIFDRLLPGYKGFILEQGGDIEVVRQDALARAIKAENESSALHARIAELEAALDNSARGTSS